VGGFVRHTLSAETIAALADLGTEIPWHSKIQP
jgi:hypothetical protein